MCAVMGPSGAGKTTLLDIISRRKTEGKLSGKNYFDGAVPSKSMVKKYTAYIQQQDCFFGGATVSETILFAAMAKLPPGQVSMEEKRAKVAEVIAQLNLSRCANTYMGNRLIRGVSGGEMKRTAVACALLCSPRCMFLDEPTSGLDSAMAQEVIGNLRALQVKQGCTFVVTIHQPAPVVFDAFNRLVLLNLGRLAYWGDGRTAPLEFFAAQGFPYRPGYNVAEYLIDTLSTNDSGTGGAHDFEGYYAKSSLCEENTAVVRETVEACDSGLAVDSGIHADGKGKSKYANGFWRELWVLLRYKGLPRAKHPLFISLRVLLYILLAALLSSFFYSQDRQLTGIFNTIGILFIAVILPCFMAQVFVEEMKFDREVYTREFNDAYYRAGTYVAARILTEIPYLFLSGGAFASVLYWCIGTERRLGEVRLLRTRHLRQLRHRHARRVHHRQRDRRRGRTRGGAPHIHHAEHARRRVLHPQGHHPLNVDLALLDLIPPVDVVRHHAQRVRGRGVHRPLRRRRRRPQVIPRHHAFVPAADQGRRVVRVQQAPRRLRGGPRRLGAREFRARRARQVEMPRVRGVFHPGAHRAVLLRRPVRATREALISLSSE
jgi:ABC-type multidrug transport system ATPase subunit